MASEKGRSLGRSLNGKRFAGKGAEDSACSLQGFGVSGLRLESRLPVVCMALGFALCFWDLHGHVST